eukprot:TRINITY_DN8266_c0_g1_i1.p1 TRINITY_DN8266_c0_g1~~TRINITY_DN8266_c0_g1_i1.p1  ORF type:complete len:958 (-),score=159.44 TRINITY_DN8266_c0_g1_i1:59-2857(-)
MKGVHLFVFALGCLSFGVVEGALRVVEDWGRDGVDFGSDFSAAPASTRRFTDHGSILGGRREQETDWISGTGFAPEQDFSNKSPPYWRLRPSGSLATYYLTYDGTSGQVGANNINKGLPNFDATGGGTNNRLSIPYSGVGILSGGEEFELTVKLWNAAGSPGSASQFIPDNGPGTLSFPLASFSASLDFTAIRAIQFIVSMSFAHSKTLNLNPTIQFDSLPSPPSDLSVQVTGGGTADIRADVQIVCTLKNEGQFSADATDITTEIDVSPSDGIVFVSSTAPGAYVHDASAGTGIWTVDSLDASAKRDEVSITLSFQTKRIGTTTVDVEVTGASGPILNSGVVETVNYNVIAIDLEMNFEAAASSLAIGENTTLTVTIQNSDSSGANVAASNVVIEVIFDPADLVILSNTPSSGTFNGTHWIIPSIALTAIETLIFEVEALASSGSDVTASVISSDQVDLDGNSISRDDNGIVSFNGGGPIICGDGFCSAAESCVICAADCCPTSSSAADGATDAGGDGSGTGDGVTGDAADGGGGGDDGGVIAGVIVGVLIACCVCCICIILILLLLMVLRKKNGSSAGRGRSTTKLTVKKPDFEELLFVPYKDIASKKGLGELEKLIVSGDPSHAITRTATAQFTKEPLLLRSVLIVLEFNQATIQTVKDVLATEIEKSSKKTILRSNSPASRLFTAYARVVGLPYLWENLARPVAELMNRETQDADIEAGSSDGGFLEISMIEIDPTRTKSLSEEEARVSTLQFWLLAQKLLAALVKSHASVPAGIREIIKFTRDIVDEKFDSDVSKIAVGSLFFLRYVCPALIAPHQYGICSEQVGPGVRRSLMLLVKVFQNLANGTLPGKKEEYMKKMNSFIEENSATLPRFYDNLCGGGGAGESFVMKEQKKNKALGHIADYFKANKGKVEIDDDEVEDALYDIIK